MPPYLLSFYFCLFIWKSSVYLDCICSLSDLVGFIHFIPVCSSNYLIDAGLPRCVIALIYLSLFHRTYFSSSNQVPINISSKHLVL